MERLYSLVVISVLLIIGNAASCKDSCPCSDFDYLKNNEGNVSYSPGPGCSGNITCRSNFWTYITSSFAVSAFEKPEDARNNNVYIDSVLNNDEESSLIDFFSFYGLVCEDGNWFATKYPRGWSYPATNGQTKKGTTGPIDGMKTYVGPIKCGAKLSPGA